MANVSQTAANVKIKADNQVRTRQAGEAITQGMPYYISTTDGKAYQTDANDGSAKAEARGIAITPASTDEYFVACDAGLIDIGGTLSVGQVYVVSATKGAIAPISDLVSNDYVTVLGIALTASTLDLSPDASGVQKA